MWVKHTEKKEYLDSCKYHGLRIVYANGLDEKTVFELEKLIKYIRKRYFFPIRCNIYLTNHEVYKSNKDGHKFWGVFFDESDSKRKIYPKIYVASKETKNNNLYAIKFTLLHELTHYFQWFWLEDKSRTDRSLEIEANRWAHYIYGCYIGEYKEDD